MNTPIYLQNLDTVQLPAFKLNNNNETSIKTP